MNQLTIPLIIYALFYFDEGSGVIDLIFVLANPTVLSRFGSLQNLSYLFISGGESPVT